MPRNCAVCLVGVLVACVTGEARASSSTQLPIDLAYVGCDALDHDELEKLLAVEFQTLNVQQLSPLERVRVTCEQSRALVAIDGTQTVNEVELSTTARAAWPRLLALSVSEIVIASRAHIVLPEAPAPPAPAPAKVTPKAAPAVIRPGRALRVHAGVALRRAFRSKTWLAGPELGLQLDWSRNFAFAADVRAEFGSTDTELARVHWASARGALSALVGASVSSFRFGVGPGLAVGYLRWSPTVSAANGMGHVVSGAWGGPELVARAHWDFAEHWFALASLDSGIVTWPVSGLVDDGRRLLDGGGAWASGALALGALF